jgi:cytochrome c oxidase subunit II
MKLTRLGSIFGLMAGAAFAGASGAIADEAGYAVPDQMTMIEPVTKVAEDMQFFHNDILLPIITIISVFVLGLLLYVMLRFNAKANPNPSRTTHSTVLEVAWTIIPVLILVVIAIPSFRILTEQLVLPKADITIKVTGKQWFWSYDYSKDDGDFGFDSLMKPEKELKPGDLRLLAVDNEAVVPVGKTVRLQITSADVIHSFVVQSFGVRLDAVPGRLNQTWFRAEKEGIYYGQCSKLCGKDHAFMPIAFRVVSQQKYEAWLADAKKKFASAASPDQHAEIAADATVH